jgi:hypothetical protein
MGDGLRVYYEKPDVITFYGVQMSLTEAALRAFIALGKVKLNERRLAIMAGIQGQQAVWPEHNLLCACSECNVKHNYYSKGLKN